MAEQHGLSFFETSAKTGYNVAEVFQHIAKVILREKIPNGTTATGMNGSSNGKNGMGPKGIKMTGEKNEKD